MSRYSKQMNERRALASQKSGVAQACAKGSIFLGVFFFVSFFWTSKRKKGKYLHPFQ
jgi:hypothetical protein